MGRLQDYNPQGVARCTQQHCWCTQQLCEWAKLPLFKKREYLHTEEGSFVVVIFNCGRTFFHAISWNNFFRMKSRKKVLLQLKITTAEELSSVDSCGRTSSARSHGRRFFHCCYFQLWKNFLP